MFPNMPDSGAARERRRFPRKNIIESQLLTAEMALVLGDSDVQSQHGIVIDLSEGGMAVQPFRPLAPGAVGQVQLDLPGGEKPFAGQGKVAWIGTGGRAGIRFLDAPAGSRQLLHEWLTSDAGTKEELREPVPEVSSPHSPPVANSDELDFLSALQLIAERAQVITAASGAAIAIGDSQEMICQATIGQAPDIGARIQPNAGLSGYCLQSEEIVHCQDTQSDARVDAAAARQLNLGSVIIIPVFASGRLSGLLEVFSPRPNSFDSRQAIRLERFAELLGSAIAEHERSRKLDADAPSGNSQSEPKLTQTPDSPAIKAELLAETGKPEPMDSAPQLSSAGSALLSIPPDDVAQNDLGLSEVRVVQAESTAATVDAAAPSVSKEWRTCRACGHQNPPWADRCENCHATQQPGAEPMASSSVAESAPLTAVTENAPIQSDPVTPVIAKPLAVEPLPPAPRTYRTILIAAIIALILALGALGAGLYFGRAGSPIPRSALPAPATPAAVSSPHAPSEPGTPTPMALSTSPERPETGATVPNDKGTNATASAKAGSAAKDRLLMWPEKGSGTSGRSPREAGKLRSASSDIVISTALVSVNLPENTAGATPPRLSGGKLVRRVDPIYPASARAASISGEAVLSAIIKKNGTVDNVTLIDGPKELGAEAATAVRQWQYEPFEANGQPVDVQARITVNFAP